MVSWDTVALSYSSGLLAAVSPCVVVLIPLVLFRFMSDTKRKSAHAHEPPKRTPHRDVLLFAVGFQFSYLLFGYFLSQLLTSSIQNGFKIGLGSLFVMLSALSITNRLDPMHMPLFDNTFLMGVSFALLLSFNPCTVPFLAVIISLNTRDALLALLCFGQGLLTPSLVFIYLGRGCINMVKKKGQIMHWLNKLMSAMLGMMGVYLIFATPVMAVGDLAVAGIMGVGTGLLALSSLSLIDLSPSGTPAPSAASAVSRCCTRVTTAIPRPARVALMTGLVLTLVVGFICWGAQYEAASHTALLMDTLQSKVSPVVTESPLPEAATPAVEMNVVDVPLVATQDEEPVRYSYRNKRSAAAASSAAAVPVESPSSAATATVVSDDHDEPVERLVLDEATGVISSAAVSSSPSSPSSSWPSSWPSPRSHGAAPRGPPSPLDVGEHDDPDGEATCIDTSKIPECGPCRFCINAHAALACLGFAATVAYHLYDTRRAAEHAC